MTELWQLGARDLARLYGARQASPVEVLEASLERIRALDGMVGAFACVLAESARAAARRREEELARGMVRGPLHGVPVGVKELFDVEGAPGDYGSHALAGRVAGLLDIGDVAMVKGSAATGLGEVVETIRGLDARPRDGMET